MKKLTLFTFLFIFLIQNNVFAQMEKAQTVLSTAPYVFDGVVLGFHFTQDDSGQYFMSYAMKVKQRLKGDADLKPGDTVEVIMPLPDRYQVFEDGSYGKSQEHKMPSPYFKGWSMGVNTQGIFGIQKSTLSVTGNKNLKSFEPSVLPKENSYFAIVPYLVKYDNIEHVNVCTYTLEGFGVHFANFSDFNAFLAKMNLPAISDLHPYEKKSAETIKQDSLNAVQYAKRIEKAKENDEYLKMRMQNVALKPNSKANEQITFETANEQVTGTGTQYFEFDIMVFGNTSNTYLDNAAFVVEFNTFAFGVDLSANNLVTITRGTDYNTSTYLDPQNFITDEASNAIRFYIGTDYNGTSWNRVQVTSIPNQLLHVKMQLNDCNGFSNINFSDITGVSGVDFYTDSPSLSPLTDPFSKYDYAEYVQPSPYALCPPPAISGFSPQTITAGTKSILTIYGNGFGNTRGTSQVRFMDADTSNYLIQFLDAVDYLSWSDTEIQLILPHFVDSLTKNFYPGSGIFSIKKGNGDTLFSPSPINIKYSVKNLFYGTYGAPDYEKIPYHHVDFTDSLNGHAREFSLDTSITNNPQMAAIVFKALKTWTCVTGINWVVTDTVEQRGFTGNGKSIIFLTDSDFDADTNNILGLTQSFAGQKCFDNVTNEKYVYWKETDIAFARYKNIATQTPMKWFYDTTMTKDVPADSADFYAVVMHELGHAHNLGHVRDNSDIMYYLIPPSPTVATSRNQLYTSPNSMDGGQYVMNGNLTLHSANCGGTVQNSTPQYVSYCGSLGIMPYQKAASQTEVLAYPNPFSQSISIQYTLSGSQEVAFRVSDLSGRVVYQKEAHTLSEGEYIESIDLSSCSQGFYMLSMQIGNTTSSYSIIKQE